MNTPVFLEAPSGEEGRGAAPAMSAVPDPPAAADLVKIKKNANIPKILEIPKIPKISQQQ
jgi:hypothetical protein